MILKLRAPDTWPRELNRAPEFHDTGTTQFPTLHTMNFAEPESVRAGKFTSPCLSPKDRTRPMIPMQSLSRIHSNHLIIQERSLSVSRHTDAISSRFRISHQSPRSRGLVAMVEFSTRAPIMLPLYSQSSSMPPKGSRRADQSTLSLLGARAIVVPLRRCGQKGHILRPELGSRLLRRFTLHVDRLAG